MPPLFPRPSPRAAALLLAAGMGTAAVVYTVRRVRKARQAQAHVQSETPAPNPGDILLFHNAKGLNKLITAFTHSPFYHVGIYAEEDTAVEARTPGVQYNDLRDRAGTYLVAPAPHGKGQAALAWAKTQIGDAYDNLDILVIILDRLCRLVHFNYTSKNKYSCGEFVAAAFHNVGAPLFPDRDLGSIVPGDFASLLPEPQRETAK